MSSEHQIDAGNEFYALILVLDSVGSTIIALWEPCGSLWRKICPREPRTPTRPGEVVGGEKGNNSVKNKI